MGKIARDHHPVVAKDTYDAFIGTDLGDRPLGSGEDREGGVWRHDGLLLRRDGAEGVQQGVTRRGEWRMRAGARTGNGMRRA